MTGRDPANPLWVVSAYYNPAGYRRRLHNFRAFRRNLAAPLMVVELSPDGRGDLHDDDADIVVRLRGDDRIWQKERLLNIGMSLLPPHVSHVAWVDADLLFSDCTWPDRARAALDRHGGMIQLFDTACHLPPEIDPHTVGIAQCADYRPVLSGLSFARSIRDGLFDELENEWGQRGGGMSSKHKVYNVRGFAWAARRDALAPCGLYEGNVIGGSDSIVALALMGQLERNLERRSFTEAHKVHVRQWAETVGTQGLFAHLGDVPQTAYHLWHGTMANRNYAGRYDILTDHDYDPVRDLIDVPGAPLRWTDPASPLAKAVGAYFFSRREDGG
ncbi:hypothetical protein [Novosphingobium acidiphilum]|uniref:hypothetical protein n=1 Tax=Novosphingobium acidiphilum TaxID=505248 RepID=UPI00041CFF39|nr:hypothetical protein [Novosphingobium acidiphilum]